MTDDPTKTAPPQPDLPPEAPPEDVQNDAVVARAFWWSLAIVGVAAAVGLGIWYGTRPGAVEVDDEPGLTDARERDGITLELPRIPFTDVTSEAGIDFVHDSAARGEKLLPETMGGGVAFFDWDADGDPDLLFTNGRPWPGDDAPVDGTAFPGLVFYENDGSGRFENVTERVGLDVDLYAMGVAAGDFDGDGRVDLFVTCLGENRLFRNTGEAFEDVSAAGGVAGSESDWSTGCGWFDFDRDGDLDLFVCNYLEWSRESDLGQNFTLAGGKRAYGRPTNFEGTFSVLYRNDGDGRFTDVSEAAGIRMTNPDTGVPMAKSLGVTFADFDGDGWLDVVVANDTVRNFLFLNQRDGTFTEAAILAGIAYDTNGRARAGMGVDVASFRDADSLGIAIGNFSNEMTGLWVGDAGAAQFEDEANSNGLGPASKLDLTFGTVFFDADNDGRLDLLAANGHLEEDIVLVQSSLSYAQPPRLFWNAGAAQDVEFVALPESSVGADFVEPIVGRGCAVADIDLDGDIDCVIGACGRAPRLLRNDLELDRHWLRVACQSQLPIVGTRVVATLADGRVLRREVMPHRSYQSQSETPITFGLDNADRIERLDVFWPDDESMTLENVDVDRVLTVERP